MGDLNLEGDLNLQENLQRWCAGNAERKGTAKGTLNLKLLIKEGDFMMLQKYAKVICLQYYPILTSDENYNSHLILQTYYFCI